MQTHPTTAPANRSRTAELRRRLASRKPFHVTFTKKDGTLRAMRCQYEGGPIKGTMMQVYDLDKQAIRTLNLSTIHTLGEIRPKLSAEVPQMPAIAEMTLEEIADLF